METSRVSQKCRINIVQGKAGNKTFSSVCEKSKEALVQLSVPAIHFVKRKSSSLKESHDGVQYFVEKDLKPSKHSSNGLNIKLSAAEEPQCNSITLEHVSRMQEVQQNISAAADMNQNMGKISTPICTPTNEPLEIPFELKLDDVPFEEKWLPTVKPDDEIVKVFEELLKSAVMSTFVLAPHRHQFEKKN